MSTWSPLCIMIRPLDVIRLKSLTRKRARNTAKLKQVKRGLEPFSYRCRLELHGDTPEDRLHAQLLRERRECINEELRLTGARDRITDRMKSAPLHRRVHTNARQVPLAAPAVAT
jgi:hypothetical protein